MRIIHRIAGVHHKAIGRDLAIADQVTIGAGNLATMLAGAFGKTGLADAISH